VGHRLVELGWRRDLVLHQCSLFCLTLGRQGATDVDRLVCTKPARRQRKAWRRLASLELRPVTASRHGNDVAATDLRQCGSCDTECGGQGGKRLSTDEIVECLASKSLFHGGIERWVQEAPH